MHVYVHTHVYIRVSVVCLYEYTPMVFCIFAWHLIFNQYISVVLRLNPVPATEIVMHLAEIKLFRFSITGGFIGLTHLKLINHEMKSTSYFVTVLRRKRIWGDGWILFKYNIIKS